MAGHTPEAYRLMRHPFTRPLPDKAACGLMGRLASRSNHARHDSIAIKKYGKARLRPPDGAGSA